MPQFSQAWPTSFCKPLWAMTKFVSSSLIGVWLLTGRPSFWAAHCSQRCFSIFFPCLISVRWTVAVLLQLSHFIESPHPSKVSDRSNRISPVAPGQFSIGPASASREGRKSLRIIGSRVLRRLPDGNGPQRHAIRQLRRHRPPDVHRHVLGRGVQLRFERFLLVKVAVVHGHDD